MTRTARSDLQPVIQYNPQPKQNAPSSYMRTVFKVLAFIFTLTFLFSAVSGQSWSCPNPQPNFSGMCEMPQIERDWGCPIPKGPYLQECKIVRGIPRQSREGSSSGKDTCTYTFNCQKYNSKETRRDEIILNADDSGYFDNCNGHLIRTISSKRICTDLESTSSHLYNNGISIADLPFTGRKSILLRSRP